jgi:hypothetical protein
VAVQGKAHNHSLCRERYGAEAAPERPVMVRRRVKGIRDGRVMSDSGNCARTANSRGRSSFICAEAAPGSALVPCRLSGIAWGRCCRRASPPCDCEKEIRRRPASPPGRPDLAGLRQEPGGCRRSCWAHC